MTLHYRERLYPSWTWWLMGFVAVGAVGVAMIRTIPATEAWIITGLTAVPIVGALLAAGRTTIAVDGGELRAGRAHIAGRHLGTVEALDAVTTRHVLGVGGDVRAYLLTRPFVSGSVRVEITDPADPAPYWLLSTRHPARLAAAITALTQNDVLH